MAFLVDGAAYFDAFVAAAEHARHSIVIVGWDVHSQTPLPSRDTTLLAFLDDLAARRRGLRIYVLDWDFAMLYALEREFLPAVRFGWRSHRRVRFALDGLHPVGASHHQKLVVIDDGLAFAGGLDLTISRWDTPEHRHDDPRRTLPDGSRYGPFHDVQIAVDGEAARSLGEIARQRWLDATGKRIRPCREAAAWPRALRPDLVGVPVAIARTVPAFEERAEIREVERLYLDSVAAARRSIYIENQYLSAASIAPALAERLREEDGPEVVVVSGKACSGWLEEQTMGALRAAWLHELRAADRHGRLRVYCPIVAAPAGFESVNVHAKVMIVDDSLARVGSANLSNRSFGLDTECDLAIESEGVAERALAILRFRNQLIAEHLDATPRQVEEALERHRGSLIEAIESLRTSPRTLEEIPLPESLPSDLVRSALALADPERPISAEALTLMLMPEETGHARPASWRLTAMIAAVLLVALVALFMVFGGSAPV